MPSPPRPFAQDTYSAWHDATFPADAPLADKVAELRTGLVASSRDALTVLAQILTYTADYCLFEYEKAAKTATDYHLALSEALRGKSGTPAYELLFKSTESIINKLWRKNVK